MNLVTPCFGIVRFHQHFARATGNSRVTLLGLAASRQPLVESCGIWLTLDEVKPNPGKIDPASPFNSPVYDCTLETRPPLHFSPPPPPPPRRGEARERAAPRRSKPSSSPAVAPPRDEDLVLIPTALRVDGR
ncbi:hypothetical protein NL676_032295 [Syzygium grande]|nr:hypothetical protein NL676_032295 [Syzygium grande]